MHETSVSLSKKSNEDDSFSSSSDDTSSKKNKTNFPDLIIEESS